MKKKFDIDEYPGRYDSMCCETEEQAELFLAFLNESGRKWCNGMSYLDRTNFNTYREETCYYFNGGTYGSSRSSGEHNGNMLMFSDFEWDGFDCSGFDITDELSCYINTL